MLPPGIDDCKSRFGGHIRDFAAVRESSQNVAPPGL